MSIDRPCPHMRPSWRSCPHCLGVNHRESDRIDVAPETSLTAVVLTILGTLALYALTYLAYMWAT